MIFDQVSPSIIHLEHTKGQNKIGHFHRLTLYNKQQRHQSDIDFMFSDLDRNYWFIFWLLHGVINEGWWGFNNININLNIFYFSSIILLWFHLDQQYVEYLFILNSIIQSIHQSHKCKVLWILTHKTWLLWIFCKIQTDIAGYFCLENVATNPIFK